MSDLLEVTPSSVPQDQRTKLNNFVESLSDSPLRELLQGLSEFIDNDTAATLIANQRGYTPAEVARKLGMSRTHLYKLLDSGEMPSYRIGRDRRIMGADVIAFEQQRQAERRTLAERFANAQMIREAAIDELADEL